MNKNKIDRLIRIMYMLSAILVLLGAFFKIQHYPYGNYLLVGGLIVGTLIGLYEFAFNKL